MAGQWFESVPEARRRAKRNLPRSAYAALLAGSERGVTLTDNVLAFDELRFRPHVADLPVEQEQATTTLGQHIALPVVLSPVGAQAVHPEAEVAVAGAAAAAGTAIGPSSFASKPVEEVAAANPRLFLQTYWVGGRDRVLARVERARHAQAQALIVTLDWTFDTYRDWGSPPIPEKLDLAAMARFAPEVLARPRYLAAWLSHGTLPDLTVPSLALPGEPPPTFFAAYREWMNTPPATRASIQLLGEQWNGPFLVKGIMRPDDARRAVDAGATAISVSNHGGNNLDTRLASIRVLPAIAEAVGSQIEVLFGGGIRRGADVVKALALGARAVMISRAYLWGLGAGGESGVKNVLETLRNGIDSALLGVDCASVHDLAPDHVVVPAGFTP
ncbi:MAG: mycofactocin biosynthesis FMN-dependent deaminase MftD [Pseudonocardia sp.]|uniref:pre-mycofactocin synthase MftD n=1 Tax=unclassified Pseudonocardia TaxID=2619320 RepID=UPI00086C30C9|nr:MULTISPECIES: pre-mycofactocin synthase MftD [unclassified Pseudonocardia]MBN9113632.1 mycofactocin biosynthesis FMN-dependent deaminase MftD [Pseudonocardia sp.]ODU24937.1 MAG: alpha-hydroxy-acid oxidizing enzyme [Pseudonocardia sp. SCN 72-51]ODU99118.1 MAG: alpha-hydroxy-acid oxidizing enzyme [Pseudonocardia sp. SCN 73-27]